MVICSQPECQTTAGCICRYGMTGAEVALRRRVAELEALLRETHDSLLISAALLRKYDHPETANMVQAVHEKICAAVPTTQVQ